MRDKLLDYPVLHCDETRLQVLHEPGRDPSAQSWMWVQSGGPPDKPVILFDYTASRAQEVPLRLLDGYRGYLMTDDYAGYNAVAARDGIERLGCWAHARRKFVEAQGQDWACRRGAEPDQQALRHRARHGRGGRCPAIPDAPVAKPGFPGATES